ncbi:hypothetical protein C8R44DRAFT_339776 [Mycena epipterygia]|nr:hypothetical protein C8R44DRAFT_339776 [Mycena epipterygia]
MSTAKRPQRDLRFPQELVDAIVQELEEGSACLVACLQTAKTFRAPCQRRIFRVMVIHSEASGFSNTFQRACSLLTVSPHLAMHVHHLTIPLPIEAKEIRSLENVLGALDKVQRFVISNPGELNHWGSSSHALISAILRMVSHPSLDRLHLKNMSGVPSSLIYRAASSVRVLSLDTIYVANMFTATVHAQLPPSPLRLEHLIFPSSRSMRQLSGVIRELRKKGYLQRLRRLSLTLETVPYEDYLDIFAPLSETIRHVEIDFREFRGLVTIAHFKHLQVLELSFYIGMSRQFPYNLELILSDLPTSTPLLERLTLTFGIMPRIPETVWVDDGPWPTFDAGFMERRTLPHLGNVTCCLHLTMDYFHGDQDVSYPGFVAAMEANLPGLRGTDVLTFTRRHSSYRYQDHLP